MSGGLEKLVLSATKCCLFTYITGKACLNSFSCASSCVSLPLPGCGHGSLQSVTCSDFFYRMPSVLFFLFFPPHCLGICPILAIFWPIGYRHILLLCKFTWMKGVQNHMVSLYFKWNIWRTSGAFGLFCSSKWWGCTQFDNMQWSLSTFASSQASLNMMNLGNVRLKVFVWDCLEIGPKTLFKERSLLILTHHIHLTSCFQSNWKSLSTPSTFVDTMVPQHYFKATKIIFKSDHCI